MVLQVMVQSGTGGGLLAIVTVSIDRISLGSAVQAQAHNYQTIKGNTSTPQTSVAVRGGPSSWTETFTVAANGTSRDLIHPQRDWAWLVKAGTGTPTAWNVDLQISIDNANWTTIDTHANTTDTLGKHRFVASKVGYYMRVVVNSVTIVSGNFTVLVASMS